MKILCISDRVEAVISCGDLPFDYLEYIVTFLGVPLYYVLGNHDPAPDGPERPEGCTPLDGRVVDADGVVLGGLSGSRLYSGGQNQYTERQMRRRALALSARIHARSLLARPALGIRRSRGSRPYRLRGVPGAHRPPQTLPVATRARPPLRARDAEGLEPGRDQGDKRLRAPHPGGVAASHQRPERKRGAS